MFGARADRAAGRALPQQRSAPARRVAAEATLTLAARETLAALKAWRAGVVAREHNLPAYIIFNDATLRAIAQAQPQRLAELEGIPGLGQKKLEAYGAEVLRVVNAAKSHSASFETTTAEPGARDASQTRSIHAVRLRLSLADQTAAADPAGHGAQQENRLPRPAALATAPCASASAAWPTR